MTSKCNLSFIAIDETNEWIETITTTIEKARSLHDEKKCAFAIRTADSPTSRRGFRNIYQNESKGFLPWKFQRNAQRTDE